jgi:formylglycine-generating enzyme required for sulfatase activity
MFGKAIVSGVLAVALILAASSAQADVFSMPAGQGPSLQFVPVGNPGNAADPATGSLYGSVGYNYNIGKYDVTVGQYCQFLNAVAQTDTYGLWNSYMEAYYPTVGITQTGTSGNFSYSVTYNSTAWNTYSTNYPSLYPSPSAAANACPIFSVTWGDAARFCNWLQNGQLTGAEGPSTTETGAYSLNGATSSSALMAIVRNPGAIDVIPTENEWYKAAYYDPTLNGGLGGYWTYPTKNNTAPSNVLSSTGTNNANYYNGSSYTDPTNELTPVGVFADSPSAYGTYDQGGDVFQWNEANIDGVYRGGRGGDWFDTEESSVLASSSRGGTYPSNEDIYCGFRVASVPEPGSITLLVCGAIVVLIWWRRRG